MRGQFDIPPVLIRHPSDALYSAAVSSRYDDLAREDLIRLLERRDARQRYGLLWEREGTRIITVRDFMTLTKRLP